MKSRLDAVLKTIYLLFNEGYNSSHSEELLRNDLCYEALRLCYLLTENDSTNVSATKALVALMCFQASRLEARLDQAGQIILLRDQDRSKWNQQLISKGFFYLDQAVGGSTMGNYQLEAAIAGLHAASPDFNSTYWNGIYRLYQQLHRISPTSIIALHKAVAAGYAISPQTALQELECINGLND